MMQTDVNTKPLQPGQANATAGSGGVRLNPLNATFARLGIGRTTGYRALNPDFEYRRGLPLLRSVTIGGRRLVSDAAIEEFIAELEAQSAA